MHVVVRLRILLARHGWIRWAIALTIAVGVGWTSHQHSAAVDRERDAWGTTAQVVVARRDLEPGDAIDAEVVSLPAAMIPAAALRSTAPEARIRQHVPDGAVITSADVSAARGPAAFAEPGTIVVGVLDPLARNASIGLPVIVSSEGVVLAAEATIVGVIDEVILVAVPTAAGPTVAAAAQLGAVSLLFVP